MNKHLKLFANHTAYEAVKNNIDKPNVVMCQQEDEVHFNPTPQPIAPVGRAQVFANPQCTEYADGKNDTVWIRLNQDFEFNDYTSWGDPFYSKTSCIIGTPTTQWPQEQYGITVWADWVSKVRGTTPLTAGVYECYYQGFDEQYYLNNPQVIFE